MTPRETLIQIARANDNKLTKKQAVEAIGRRYYCNEAKHTGEVLSAMVKRGILRRDKPGQFTLIAVKGLQPNSQLNNENQTNLF